MSKIYFANLPTDQFIQEVEMRIRKFNRFIENKGLKSKWERSYDLYYGRHQGEESLASGEVDIVGDDGELTSYGVNHYRSLIKNILSMTTAQKPDFDPRAVNSDLTSLQQTKIAAGILDSYLDEQRMNRFYQSAAERSLVYGKGYVVKTWDPGLGEAYSSEVVTDPETGEPLMNDESGQPFEKIIREGDVSCRAKGPMDVGYDVKLKDYSKRTWEWVREWENKWDLAARHPHLRDQILAQDGTDELASLGTQSHTGMETSDEDGENDLIPVYYFIHKITDACPKGRFAKFLNGNVALFDGETPYEDKMITIRITPGEMFDSTECYTEAFDLMALQQVYNSLVSTIFTNQSAFGRPVIHLPDGTEVSEEALSEGGPLFIKGGPPGVVPTAIQLCATPPEIFTNLNLTEKQMEKIAGTNSTMRGDPETNLKSGVALGRMQAMALQQNSPFQKSYAELLEDGGSLLFFFVKRFVKTERIAAYVGKNNRAATVAFTGESISDINRVVVDLGNPLTRTAAGRLELADNMMSKGLITTPQEYLTVLKTGNLDPLTEGPEATNELIRKENEDLMEGKPAMALVGDKHILHAQEHMALLSDTMLRTKQAEGDPLAAKIVAAILAHIDEHKGLWQSQETFFGILSGEPPPPPPPMPPMVPPGAPMPPDLPPGPPPPNPMQPPDAPQVPPVDVPPPQQPMGV